MSVSTISARIDTNDKYAFDSFCSRVGMNSSTAINLFIKTVIREQRIPFSIESDPFYHNKNQEYILKSVSELKAGKGQAHGLIEE